jgi:hypothetical protein
MYEIHSLDILLDKHQHTPRMLFVSHEKWQRNKTVTSGKSEF